MRGFKDFSPKPWSVLFRDMQAAGGGIEIKSLRIERTDAVVVGSGALTVNEHGNLDGLIHVAVAGVENIVPLLGVDQMIGQGIDRLTGGSGSPSQGFNALDRLLPGLGGVVRESANVGPDRDHQENGPADRDRQKAGGGAAAARHRRRDFSRPDPARRGAAAVLSEPVRTILRSEHEIGSNDGRR